jgi:hypothetical protein
MRTTAEAFARVLIDHHDHICKPRRNKLASVTDADISACTITYGDLCRKAKAGCPTGAGTFLYEIHKICEENRLPPLNSLVVNARKGHPGDSYPHKLNWQSHVKECIASRSYPPINNAMWNA